MNIEQYLPNGWGAIVAFVVFLAVFITSLGGFKNFFKFLGILLILTVAFVIFFS